MAEGTCRVLGCRTAVATTGVAGPDRAGRQARPATCAWRVRSTGRPRRSRSGCRATAERVRQFPPSRCSTCCARRCSPVCVTSASRRGRHHRLSDTVGDAPPVRRGASRPMTSSTSWNAARPARTGVRYTTRPQWHVTLRFFGEADVDEAVDALDAVDALAARGHRRARPTGQQARSRRWSWFRWPDSTTLPVGWARPPPPSANRSTRDRSPRTSRSPASVVGVRAASLVRRCSAGAVRRSTRCTSSAASSTRAAASATSG